MSNKSLPYHTITTLVVYKNQQKGTTEMLAGRKIHN